VITFGSYNHICRNLSLGLATKAKGLQGYGPRRSPGVKAKRPQGCGPRRSSGVTSHTLESVKKCEGVWGSEPSHSQGNSHFGRWSPRGLPKLQKAISRVKTQWLVAFFISLKRSWNENVQNGLVLLIWTSETQVMAKRRAKNQIANLTPDQKKSKIDLIYLASEGVRISLKSSQRKLQLYFRPHFDPRSARKVMGRQSRGSPN
jgi:hypothetical protein